MLCHRYSYCNQHGAALLLMLIIMVLGAASFLINSLIHSTMQIERDLKTSDALAQAKEALISYAVTYGDFHSGEVHGFLPCPDSSAGNPEGSAELVCGEKNVSRIGRLPWKTMGLTILRDGYGECLWYAVSGTYKNSPKTDLMNWDNKGQLEILDVNGAIVALNAVAVVFAPGAVRNIQNRSSNGTAPLCGGNYTAANYFDIDPTNNYLMISGIVNAISQFHLNASPQANDQMIFITKDDIWNAMARRNDFHATLNSMTQMVAECVANFGHLNRTGVAPDSSNHSLPWPAPLTLSDYGDNENYNDKKDLYAGRIPYQVDTSRSKTGNSIGSDYLLTNSGKNCPDPTKWAAIYPWWDNWKDHLFYGLGHEFSPDIKATQGCGNCLKVNGSGKYAAVVLFAGAQLPPITRSNKGIVTDYLEGRNSINFHAAAGIENYQMTTPSATFNDILYCIKEDLTVMPCP